MPKIIEEYYVEMAWDCKACNVQNPGSSKICFNCGKFLAREEFHNRESRPTSIADKVVDEKLLVKAKAGSDWECKFCSSHQQRGNGECATCGAGEKFSNVTTKLSDEKELSDEEINDSHVGIIADEPSKTLIAQRQAARQVEYKNKELGYQRAKLKKNIVSVVGPLILIIIVSFFVWLFTPKYIYARVSDVYFQHIVHVERNIITSDSGFHPDNGAFDIREDGRKVHHTEKVQHGWDYPLTSETVIDPPFCYFTPVEKKDGNCVSQKNGFKKCQKITTGGDKKCDPRSHVVNKPKKTPHYENDPVYQTWYTWRIHKWVWNRSIPISGHTNEVYWPTEADIALNQNCSLEETERVKQDAVYSISFTNKNDTWKYTPSGLSEYQKLKIGNVYQLKVVAGIVTILQ